MIKVNELFSGIGAFRKALINLNIAHEIVGISEIDKYAIKSYEAMYGETRNYGDISKIEKLDYADLWTYGFPCQDISNAGLQKGIILGETRSGLLYEVQRLLETALIDGEPPKWLIMENVKALVGKKFKPKFDEWIEWLNTHGYNTYWQVMNAADYGIPQRRERVIAVSIRADIDKGFEFPEPIPLETTFTDLLEDEVDERFYLTDSTVEWFEAHNQDCKDRQLGFRFEPVERERESQRHCRLIHSGNTKTISEGVVILNQGKTIKRGTDIAVTLLARDWKGLNNYGMNGVIEHEL